MFSVVPIQPLSSLIAPYGELHIDVLRMDKIHTIVSGNKWFKLSGYLTAAKQNGYTTICTFGGAFSNHIVATAYAAKMMGFKSMGVIRGERPKEFSATLQNAAAYGMELSFVSREAYKDKSALQNALDPDGLSYWVPEGGYGKIGAQGIKDMLRSVPYWDYTHIFTAVGTGTTLAGLIEAALPYQKIIGVSVLNNLPSILAEVKDLLSEDSANKNFDILGDYTFGGYAKKSKELIHFMAEVYENVKLPLDFVYTAKAFYGMLQYTQKAALAKHSKLLFLHTGGLQGNQSLPQGSLPF